MDAEMEEKRSKVEDEEVTKGEMEEEQEVQRVQEVQALIKKLSEKQKLALQEQIMIKQRQVLPYNEVSSKQKEILALLSKELRFTTHPSVSTLDRFPASLPRVKLTMSTPSPCLLCNEKSGRELRLVGGNTSEVFSLATPSILSHLFSSQVTEHYKLCLYKLGKLQAIVPPQPINTNSEGEAIDEIGSQFVYKCKVKGCDRAGRGAKLTSYKEYLFHCYQSHGLMKLALKDSMENTKDFETKQKFRELILMLAMENTKDKTLETKQKFLELVMMKGLLKPENVVDHVETIAEPSVEEIHTCLLCRGINRDTKKENKEAKALKFNICTTRNHYANCLNETEEGRLFFENTYKTPGDWVRIKCDTVQCRNQKRFRDGFTSAKMFYSHMALHHGGLEGWMSSQAREDVRELVPRLLCQKRPEVCFVPDHYGQ